MNDTPQLPLFTIVSDDLPPIVPITDKVKDIAGQRFGRLVAIGYVGKNSRYVPRWLLACDCGNKIIANVYNVVHGKTQSCGCLHSEQLAERNTTFGLSHIPGYDSWYAMIDRCTNPRAESYALYGGRGIAVCERWQNSPENFINDMGPRPGPEYSIDRIDNDLGYFPENCRWATPKQQSNNTRTNRFLEFQGERLTIAQWGRKIGISRLTLGSRLKAGWSVERTLTTPKSVR